MAAQLARRVLREVGLGVLAIIAAGVVLLPGLWVIDAVFRRGEYVLLIVTVLTGCLLLLYQARLRPALREPTQRMATSLAEAFGSDGDYQRRDTPSDSAFRIWGGVPIAALRVFVYGGLPPSVSLEPFCSAMCTHVRARAALSGALTWALREVGGTQVLLLQEPELGQEPLDRPAPALLEEETYRHLWSANGPASYEEPVAFATVLRTTSRSGEEAVLYEEAVRLARKAATIPGIAGVEVLLGEPAGSEPPRVLWLAAGIDRSARRQVYRAVESAAALRDLASAIERYDLLACDAYVPLRPIAAAAPG